MKPFRIVIFIVAIVAGITGYFNAKSKRSNSVTSSSGETIVYLPTNDQELKAAADKAREQWSQFTTEFNQHQSTMDFSVKAPLPTKDGSAEHIWIAVTSIENETIRGTLANDPYEDIGFKNGDPVTVQLATIDDWLIRKGDKIVFGGFSLEVLKKHK